MSDLYQLDYPRTVRDAVAVLLERLDDAEKAEVAALPKDELMELSMSASAERIRNFWTTSPERALRRGDADSPALMINPDDAAMFLLETLWHRLHC